MVKQNALALLAGVIMILTFSTFNALAHDAAMVEKTGQTTCYDSSGNIIDCAGTGKDGDYQAGIAWPVPRFTDNGDGTVTDNLTNLMWTKDANLFGMMSWADALTTCENFCSGVPLSGCCYNDWRLPNAKELHSLVDLGNSYPALPSGHPFTNVQFGFGLFYWSSTTHENDPYLAWIVSMSGGLTNINKAGYFNAYVWCVRAP